MLDLRLLNTDKTGTIFDIGHFWDTLREYPLHRCSLPHKRRISDVGEIWLAGCSKVWVMDAICRVLGIYHYLENNSIEWQMAAIHGINHSTISIISTTQSKSLRWHRGREI